MKKGFTLVELLVIIVLLAVLAMLIYPNIVNQIEKKSTTLEEKKLMLIFSASDEYLKKHSNIYSKEAGNKYFVKVSDLVKENLIAIDIEGYDDKCIIVTVGKPNGHEIGDCGEDVVLYTNFKRASSKDTYLGILYLDPTDLTKVCSKSEVEENLNGNNTPTGIKSGCMKWYAYKEDTTSYTVILDHSTTATGVTFSSINSTLSSDTSSWDSSLSPRVISADEIAALTHHPTFNSVSTPTGNAYYLDSNNQTPTATTAGSSNYDWLYNYLYNSRANGGTFDDSNSYNGKVATGHWTSNGIYNASNYAWGIEQIGTLDDILKNEASMGIRPVITIPKSLLK